MSVREISMEILMRENSQVFHSKLNEVIKPRFDVNNTLKYSKIVSRVLESNRKSFAMQAQKIADQLTMMVPERDGGDLPEDPDIGIFGGAYLCRHYINRIGLKGYDFTITDAPGRGLIDSRQLRRVYGDEVFDKCVDNGHGNKIYSNIKM